MTRWINSQIGTEVSDLSRDLQDGLILIRLINHITTESYILTPLYAKPTFKLQKVENVSDFLKFCQIVLQINICSISADDIVDGNSKLILGLIWALFIYSTAGTISINNECNSLVEVKSILLAWVNKIAHRKALPELFNFNKDWSLEINRPDLVFASILDCYSIADYNDYKNGKKLQNLASILDIASTQLHIPVLADLDDFNLFAPDEKCVIFYLLEWFKYFEMDKKHFQLDPGPVQSKITAADVTEATDPLLLGLFLELINDAVKSRNKYETRGLRLLNKLNSNRSMLKMAATYFDTREYAQTILHYGRLYLENVKTACHNNDEELLKNNAINFETFQAHASPLMCHLLNLEQFALVLKPEYSQYEYPDLAKFLHSTNATLGALGLSSFYQSSKFLNLLHLRDQFTGAVEAETKVLKSAKEVIHKLKADFENIKDLLHRGIPEELAQDATHAANYSQNAAFVETVISKVSTFDEKVLKGSNDVCLGSIETPLSTSHATSTTPSAMDAFKLSIDYNNGGNKSLSNMTFMDLTKLFKQVFYESGSNELVKSCIQLIPNRTLINRSDSDFNLHYPSDESDDSSTSVFDGLQKKVGGQLMGNYDKVYDLNSFVQKIESGFKI